MLDRAAFVLRFPEFAVMNTKNPNTVQAALDDAEARTSATVFADSTDEAHGLLAAHILARNPGGTNARLKKDETKTTYGEARKELDTFFGSGYGTLPS